MSTKIQDTSDDEIENFEDIAPLRALYVALRNRTSISISQIQTVRGDPSTNEFVVIEGSPSAATLQCLQESISDIAAHSVASKGSSFISRVGESSKTGSHFSIPSCTSTFDGIVDPSDLQNAEEAIKDLQSNGPAGIVQLSSLSDAIQAPIRVWISGTEESFQVGRNRTGEAVDVEYHEPPPGEKIGHWTLPGDEDPKNVQGQLNDCLFAVVADQTGNLAPELRSATIERMKKNVKSLAKRIEKIAKLEKCQRISLLVGGARYNGTRPQDARKVIDNSQQGRCEPQGLQGHPRGHASHPGASGPTESAENYSRGTSKTKTAFLSRADQDALGHLALQTRKAQQAMEDLNKGGTSITIHVDPGELEPGALPNCVKFVDGIRDGPERPFRELRLVLRHHEGKINDPDADVFVLTFYPIL